MGNIQFPYYPNVKWDQHPVYPYMGEWYTLKPYKKEDEVNLATLESEVTNACRSAEGILKDADTKLGQMSVTDKAKWAGIKILIDTLYELRDKMENLIEK